MGKESTTKKKTSSSSKKKTTSSASTKKEEFRVHEHVLVPKHEVLSEEEKTAFLKQEGLDEHQLPNILESDAALTGLGAKPGDIIRITRKSPTAGVSYFYRRVMHE